MFLPIVTLQSSDVLGLCGDDLRALQCLYAPSTVVASAHDGTAHAVELGRREPNKNDIEPNEQIDQNRAVGLGWDAMRIAQGL